MADNVTITAGAGTTIASDDVGGVQYQRTKVVWGADGVATDAKGSTALPVNTDPQRVPLARMRANTFRIPGRAGTAGQKLLSLFNAAGSTVLVDVEKVSVDWAATVVKAVTVLPPSIRLYRVSAAPTNGSAITKMFNVSTDTSNASVTALQDASADGTGSATTLTSTLTTGNYLTQIFAPRLITAAGYEMFDRIEFMDSGDERLTLRAGEGMVVMLDYALATQNPVTDMWFVNVRWTEYTAAA